MKSDIKEQRKSWSFLNVEIKPLENYPAKIHKKSFGTTNPKTRYFLIELNLDLVANFSFIYIKKGHTLKT
jgi:hypothetical protein